MNKFVITIGREYGSHGREIGEKLANKLGIGFYDKELLEAIEEKSGIPVEKLETGDEKLVNNILAPYVSWGIGKTDFNDTVYKLEDMVIQNIVAKESCVIIGRHAECILKEHPNCFRVFIYAPLKVRVDHIAAKYDLYTDDAKRLVKKVDNARKAYYSQYESKYKWNRKEGKDILLNSYTIGVEQCVEILYKLVREKYKKYIEQER